MDEIEAALAGPARREAASEPSLFDAFAIASREDGRDVRFIGREAALEEAGKPTQYQYADLVQFSED
ncbi:hypothetical protein RA307_10235 [Xanthobacteraceae bacterium Astr-EGSB]|uniref:hypothetical protein n=1 Tax=Astrobacterium formosum TaxID=3069710 RepID=UPI0027B0FD8A|nr:hypothetical protein [Xanthobacteraceae bacterium Astr-EGSB]